MSINDINKNNKKSQSKRRDILKTLGKRQLSTWVSNETLIKLKKKQLENKYRVIGDVIDDLVKRPLWKNPQKWGSFFNQHY